MARRRARPLKDAIPYVGRNWVIGRSEPGSWRTARKEQELERLIREPDSTLRKHLYFIWRDATGQKLSGKMTERFDRADEMPELVRIFRAKGTTHMRRAAEAALTPKEKKPLRLSKWLEAASGSRATRSSSG